MTEKQIAAMRADMAAGTPGPWGVETKRTSCGLCHQIGPWPHPWRGGADMSACIYDDYPPPNGTDAMLANARRIARVPDMEAEILRLQAENARLRDAFDRISAIEPPDEVADDTFDTGWFWLQDIADALKVAALEGGAP